MDQNKLPHKKSAKNNNSSYQNKNRQLISKIRYYSQHYSQHNTSEQGSARLKNKTEHYTTHLSITEIEKIKLTQYDLATGGQLD